MLGTSRVVLVTVPIMFQGGYRLKIYDGDEVTRILVITYKNEKIWGYWGMMTIWVVLLVSGPLHYYQIGFAYFFPPFIRIKWYTSEIFSATVANRLDFDPIPKVYTFS